MQRVINKKITDADTGYLNITGSIVANDLTFQTGEQLVIGTVLNKTIYTPLAILENLVQTETRHKNMFIYNCK